MRTDDSRPSIIVAFFTLEKEASALLKDVLLGM
jgi:hypothetical protein